MGLKQHIKSQPAINFEHISHLCSSVSIVNFEHVIAGWDFLFSLEFTCTNWTKYSRMDQVKGCLQIFGGFILEYLS